MKEITKFQSKVYEAVRRIPLGKVSTYASVAKAIDCESPRAVGQALKANPFAPEVPCHRVIAFSLKVGGFQGQTSGPAVRKKLRLLKAEGVQFDSTGRLEDMSRLL